MFQYHTFSHHSQTCRNVLYRLKNFSTIRFYIILKHSSGMFHSPMCFSTIRFYIILKRVIRRLSFISVSVPYVFTSFSNTSSSPASNLIVSVPYVFTSFSNYWVPTDYAIKFQYHTFLHHSQTQPSKTGALYGFSTIRFYIILKLQVNHRHLQQCFSTIRFYIILKRPGWFLLCH